MKLNVVIGMKHFIQMIMMTNPAIRTIVVPLQTAVSHLTEIHQVIYKRNKIEKFQQKGRKRKGRQRYCHYGKGRKRKVIKDRTGNLDIYKNRFGHQPKAPVERIQSTFSSAVTRKRKKIVLFSDSI